MNDIISSHRCCAAALLGVNDAQNTGRNISAKSPCFASSHDKNRRSVSATNHRTSTNTTVIRSSGCFYRHLPAALLTINVSITHARAAKRGQYWHRSVRLSSPKHYWLSPHGVSRYRYPPFRASPAAVCGNRRRLNSFHANNSLSAAFGGGFARSRSITTWLRSGLYHARVGNQGLME